MSHDDIAAESLPKSSETPIRLILHLAFGKNDERLHGKFETRLDGRLLCVSRQPLLDAARILLAEGVDPQTPLVTRHAASAWHSGQIDAMISTVGEAAKWTVEKREGRTEVRPLEAISRSAVRVTQRPKR